MVAEIDAAAGERQKHQKGNDCGACAETRILKRAVAAAARKTFQDRATWCVQLLVVSCE